jgi:uncharacterized protein (DUF1697 family)
MAKYAAFLRGINVGGRTMKMDALRSALEAAGNTNVKTLLASGNIVLESSELDQARLQAKIEKTIKDAFGFDVRVIVRSAKGIRALVNSEPFKGVKVTPGTRLFITFLSAPPKSKITAVGGENGIRAVTKGHVVSELGAKDSTLDHMDLLVKEFGADITTRNWNTILKIYDAMQE